jgi:predicted branched-subunit amino acid permease
MVENKKEYLSKFKLGVRQGMPIALGYLPVSFTFGLIAVKGGIPVGAAILISMTNLTSAGQFAGTSLIIANATLGEISLTTFVINIRYLLMSLSLAQRVAPLTSFLKRCIMAFGITDETFAVASLEEKEITFPYMLGLITCPYWGWALGTALGAVTSSILPQPLQSSMGIALYGMFIALIVPAAKKEKAALVIVVIAVLISSLFTWLPKINSISGGWSIIIATIVASGIGAVIFPREDEDYD